MPRHIASKVVSTSRFAWIEGRAEIEHPARIAVPAILDHGDVDVDDVADLELLVARNSVADDVIDRRADRRRIRPMSRRRVVERRGHDVLDVDLVVVGDAIEIAGRDTGLDVRREEIEELGRKAARDSHSLDLFRRFQMNGHGRRTHLPTSALDGFNWRRSGARIKPARAR
jgi:hypothetical protein